MNDPQLLEAIERYLRGEMNPEEQGHFEALRQSNPEVDQLVVEHKFFLEQLEQYGHTRDFKNTLHDVHASLSEKGEIEAGKTPSKIVYLWNRYKRVAAIAACIAGLTAIMTNALVWTATPKPPTKDQVTELERVITDNVKRTNEIQKDLNNVKSVTVNATLNPPAIIDYKKAGTGFLIDGKGLMITNAHVVKSSENIVVENTKGQRFNAIIVRLDVKRDVAIIKIDDHQFKSFSTLPYSIRKTPSKLAEEVFTLGFPRDEVVYGEGYLSAKTGYQGDTLSCQISISANPGNSGGPIFNRHGEVIGILSSRDDKAQGAVFAVQSKYIYQVVDELKKSAQFKNMKLSSKSSLNGLGKVQQVEKLQDYVFMVKADK